MLKLQVEYLGTRALSQDPDIGILYCSRIATPETFELGSAR
jgi:hypothetical protein